MKLMMMTMTNGIHYFPIIILNDNEFIMAEIDQTYVGTYEFKHYSDRVIEDYDESKIYLDFKDDMKLLLPLLKEVFYNEVLGEKK